MKNIYLRFPEDHPNAFKPVIATVAATDGSTPQKPGSTAIFDQNGLAAGTVGGGVVEGRITAMASECLVSRKSRYITFDLANDISDKSEAICGGVISILVDASPDPGVFSKMKRSVSGNIPGILITVVTPLISDVVSVKRFWSTQGESTGIPGDIFDAAGPILSEMFTASGPSGFRMLKAVLQGEDKESIILLESIQPPASLVIAGAGHIGKVLCHLGSLLGFEVTVIDDRPEFANRENLPDAKRIIVKDVGQAVREAITGQNTFLVIVTRGHKDDAEALRSSIGADLPYIGMIGSRRKIEAIKEEFISNGWATPGQWERICTPIGLEINSRTVEEIAISIAAQIILVKNSGSNKSRSCPA